ncbi:MAG: hypothetical protein J6T73_07020 [Clostridia bacterium]|nr:hypothetical protein [Clostridia bacterium]
MTRRERLTCIFDRFDTSAKEFCEAAGGLFSETSAEYKGPQKPENLKYRRAKIYFNAFIIEFKYTAHTSLGFMHSVLEAIIFPGKTEDTAGIPLPFVADYLDRDFLPPVIPFICDKEGMKQAFLHIGEVLKSILADLAEIALDPGKKGDLLKYYYSDLEPLFNIKIDIDSDDEYQYAYYKSDAFYRFITTRFSTNAYIMILKGNNEGAIKELKKCKAKFGYEKRLLRRLEEGKTSDFSDISAVLKNFDAFGKRGAPKGDFKEFFTLFVSWFILGAAASAVYVPLFLFFYFLARHGSVYLMGAIYNLPYCFFFGFLSGIAASYFTRFWFYKLFFKKDYKHFSELDHIANGATSDKIMKFLLKVIAVCSLAGCVLLPNQNIKFSGDGFTDNTKLFTLAGEYHGYNEIKRIYYLPDRVNGFGETMGFPSYVMELKDGTQIDFYEYDEIENYETELFEVLEKKGIKIERK